MTQTIWPRIEDLVPHKRDMLLLDRIVSETDRTIRVVAEIGTDNVFLVPGFGVPGWVGFEMMAQAVATHDGLKRWRSGGAISLGFLVACRHYACAAEWFAVGDRFEIETSPIMEPNETMMWESRLYGAGGEIAVAELMVHQPQDVVAFIEKARSS